MATQNTRIRQRLGAEIARLRVAAGMETQPDLARAAVLSPRTVVAVETGEKVSARTMRKIEVALQLPTGCIDDYLAGVITALPAPGGTARTAPAVDKPPFEFSAESRTKLIAMSTGEVLQLLENERVMRGDAAAERAARAIWRLREEAAAIRAEGPHRS